MPVLLQRTSPRESSLESDNGDNLITGMMAVQPSPSQFTKAQQNKVTIPRQNNLHTSYFT